MKYIMIVGLAAMLSAPCYGKPTKVETSPTPVTSTEQLDVLAPNGSKCDDDNVVCMPKKVFNHLLDLLEQLAAKQNIEPKK